MRGTGRTTRQLNMIAKDCLDNNINYFFVIPNYKFLSHCYSILESKTNFKLDFNRTVVKFENGCMIKFVSVHTPPSYYVGYNFEVELDHACYTLFENTTHLYEWLSYKKILNRRKQNDKLF